MALPEQITTVNLDADTDSPRAARTQLLEGIQTINALLGTTRIQSNPNPIILSIDDAGDPDYTTATATLSVLKFTEDVTSEWTLSIFNSVGVNATISGSLLKINGLLGDAGYCNIQGVRDGSPNINLQISVLRNASIAQVAQPDITPPPTPTNLTGSAGINTLNVQWTAPTYVYGRGNGQTNIYGAVWDKVSAKPTFTSAKFLNAVAGSNNLASLVSEPGTFWILWIKFQSRDGVESLSPAPSANSGLELETGQDPSKLLNILSGQITTSQLYSTLRSSIDLISSSSADPNSVNGRILAAYTTLNSAITANAASATLGLNTEITNRQNAVAAIASVKNRVFYSATEPVSDVNYTLLVNDLWFDSSNGNKVKRWNGSVWVSAQDAAIGQATSDIQSEATQRSAGDTAEANVRQSLYAGFYGANGNEYKVFNQATQPTGTVIGDVWSWKAVDGTVTFSRWNGTAWIDSVANQRSATYLGSFTTVGLPTTSNVIGDLARRSEDNVVVVWNGAAWVVKTSAASPISAFVDQEKTARVTADSAEASLRSALSVKLTGVTDPSGLNLGTLSSGIIFDEKTARATADTSEVNARQSLYAGVGAVTGTDYRVFNQPTQPTGINIGDVWSWTDALSVVTFNRWNGTAWVDSSANQRPAVFRGSFTTLPTTGNVIGDTSRNSADNSTVYVFNGTAWVPKTTSNSPISALIVQEQNARALADAAEVTARTTLSTQLVGGYTGTDPTALSAGLLYNEVQARSTADASQVTARQLLSTTLIGAADPTGKTLGNITSGILFDEKTSRSTADAAEVTARQALSTSLIGVPDPTGKNLGNITSGMLFDEVQARSTAIGSLVTRTTTLEAATNTPNAGNNPTYAALQTESTARANFDGYVSTSYNVRTTLTSGGRTVMGGFGLFGSSSGSQGPTIEFGILANKFYVGAPNDGSAPGVADIVPFVVQTTDQIVNGVTIPKGVYMDAAYIKNLTVLYGRFGNLVSDSISTAQLSATNLTVGDGTVGGILKSANFVQGNAGWVIRPDGTAQFPAASVIGQLTANQIDTRGLSIKDAAGNVILSAGTSIPTDAATSLGFNPQFTSWSGALPDGWTDWIGASATLVKEVTIVRSSPYAVRFLTGSAGSNVNAGITKTVNFGSTPLPVGTFVQGSIEMFLLGDNGGGVPGMLVRLFNNSASTSYVDTFVNIPVRGVGGWQRIPFTARVAAGSRIYGIQIFLMAAWVGFPGGSFVGDVVFDNLTFDFKDASTDNQQVSVSGGVITGIGTGNGTQVDNTILLPSIATAATTANWTGVVGGPKELNNLVLGSSFENGRNDTWASASVAPVSGSAWSKALLLTARDNEENNPIQVREYERIYFQADLASRSSYSLTFGCIVYGAAGRIAILNLIGVGPQQGFGNVKTYYDMPAGATYIQAYLLVNGPANQNLGSNYATNLYIGKQEKGATVGATFGVNVSGQITASNASTYIQDAAIQNAQVGNLSASKLTVGDGTVGGILKSANFVSGASGWVVRPEGTAEFFQVAIRGSIRGGAYSAYAWPSAGAGGGFYLGPEGLLLGSANDGKFFQVTSGGDIYAPGLSIVNGAASFAGTLTAANIVTTNNIAFGAVSSTFGVSSGGSSTSVGISVPSGTRSVHITAFNGSALSTITSGTGKDSTQYNYVTPASGVLSSGNALFGNINVLGSNGIAINNPPAGNFTISLTRSNSNAGVYYGTLTLLVLVSLR